MGKVSDKVVEIIKNHVLCSITFFFCEIRAVYEIMWKNIVKPGRSQMTIWRVRVSCWIPKATNTHSQYVIFIALPPPQWSHESASMLRYSNIACFVKFWTSYTKGTVTKISLFHRAFCITKFYLYQLMHLFLSILKSLLLKIILHVSIFQDHHQGFFHSLPRWAASIQYLKCLKYL